MDKLQVLTSFVIVYMAGYFLSYFALKLCGCGTSEAFLRALGWPINTDYKCRKYE